MTKEVTTWYSERLERDITMARWGAVGQPVLVFPTAGGDAQEIERMQMIDALSPLIAAGRIKVYSVDSIGGRAMAAREGSIEHRCWVLNQFHEYVAAEAVPAIHQDCGGAMDVLAAGASIGAFNALAVTCRYPHIFRGAVCMSGTYDLETLLGFQGNEHYYFSAPKAFLPGLEGEMLDRLRQRHILFTYGEGRWENPGESWAMADLLGSKGVPNRVVPWGQEWDHDWVTWRKMLPLYLDEMT